MADKKQPNPLDIILNTDKVNEIIDKENRGIPLKRHEKIWFDNLKGVRKGNLAFALTDEEVAEYTRCKLSVHHFAQTYCKIKREDGSIGKMDIRDYQERIIDLYTKNRFSILMASRQTGKCSDYTSLITIKRKNGITERLCIGNLYYELVQTYRNLTTLEKIKCFLYKIYAKI
jgi:hypothetical protein